MFSFCPVFEIQKSFICNYKGLLQRVFTFFQTEVINMLFCQSVEKPRSIYLSLIHVLLVVTSLVACYCWVSGHLCEQKQANQEAHKQTNKQNWRRPSSSPTKRVYTPISFVRRCLPILTIWKSMGVRWKLF